MKRKRRLYLLSSCLSVLVLLMVDDTPVLAQTDSLSRHTVVSADGISRTVLEQYNIPGTDDEMRMVLTTYPPGVGLPLHHHPSVAFNYILSGSAETQYEGEPMLVLKAGDHFQDEAERKHLIFRNPDPVHPLTYIITYVVKRGSSFLIVP
jgi:quercetin dioxygenase-like cupin family protein